MTTSGGARRKPRVLMHAGSMPVFATWAAAARHAADVTTITLPRPGEQRPPADLVVDLLPHLGGRVGASVIDRRDARRVEAVIQSLPEPIDLIHAHFYAGARHLPVLSRRLGIPYIVTEHSTAFSRDNPTQQKMTRRTVRMARRVLGGAAMVLPVSESLASAITRETAVDTPMRVLANPGDDELFHPASAPRSEVFRFINVARLAPVKNHAMLIDAIAALRGRVPPVELHLVGDGPTRSALTARAEAAGVADAVVFHGEQPSARVAELLRTSDAFVLPSYTENCSVALIEALLTGLPVVVSSAGGNPELVGAGDGLLLEPLDTQAWVTALGGIAAGTPTFDHAAIRARAQQHFSISALGDALADVYAEVLGRTRP